MKNVNAKLSEDEEQDIRRDRKANPQKRAVFLDLDEDDKNNEMDVSMSSAKENTNITNILKK